ncbi:Endonuclease/exonuclease/phosphatase [Nocardioides sp. CF8]|uniref:endonuclease/exonuclease/phosphatase family protein n=1 Tax=Nocardioides sp. CF8 TaxID=110319 RepID=UPI00032FEA6A|nr:endonuclease/exonuclease/phosphatase family protein [Nocardioides sp. CF8]EON24832.1 Endonuclease/exonuclease/phosphatase [Nocardioides sp. CF8]
MTKRENLVRAGLLLLVLGIIATLVVLDRTRGGDAPDAAPTPTATQSPSGTVVPLPTDETEEPGKPDKGEADVIPTPPPGIEAIACKKLQQSVEIRVLDFNTHRSYGGIGTVAAEIRALDPDIVLLQEIDRFKGSTGNIDQAAYFAEALGMNHAFGANVRSGGGEYGVAILSRFKILGSENYLLPNGPGGEQRGLLGVGVEIGGQEVRIYNTHLQNKIVGLREAQARHVAGIIANEENPVILGGDMNATINTATLAPLTSVLVDAWTVGSGPEGTGPNGSRIDFLLASPTIEPQRAAVLRSSISDHARLYADFVVPAATDCPKRRR